MAIKYSLSGKRPHLGREKAEGKYYAVAQHDGVLETDEFVKRVCRQFRSLDAVEVHAVLTAVAECLRRQLLDGKRVHVEPLGDFYTVINGTGSTSTANFARSNIKDVKVNWTPGECLSNLKKDATFKLVEMRKTQAASKRRDKQEVQAMLDSTQKKEQEETSNGNNL